MAKILPFLQRPRANSHAACKNAEDTTQAIVLPFVTKELRATREGWRRYGTWMLAQHERRQQSEWDIDQPESSTLTAQAKAAAPTAPIQVTGDIALSPVRHTTVNPFFYSVIRQDRMAHPMWRVGAVMLRGLDALGSGLRTAICVYYVLVTLIAVPMLIVRGSWFSSAYLAGVGILFAWFLLEGTRSPEWVRRAMEPSLRGAR